MHGLAVVGHIKPGPYNRLRGDSIGNRLDILDVFNAGPEHSTSFQVRLRSG